MIELLLDLLDLQIIYHGKYNVISSAAFSLLNHLITDSKLNCSNYIDLSKVLHLQAPSITKCLNCLKKNNFLNLAPTGKTENLKAYSIRLAYVLKLIIVSLGMQINNSHTKKESPNTYNEFLEYLTRFSKSIKAGQSISVVNLQQVASEVVFQYKFMLK